MKDLLDIRKDIDKIDEQIVKLYEERMKLTSDVAEYKINTGKQIFDKEREESKLATLQKKAESDFTRHGLFQCTDCFSGTRRCLQPACHGTVFWRKLQ